MCNFSQIGKIFNIFISAEKSEVLSDLYDEVFVKQVTL